MNCTSCGTALAPGSRFCTTCGTPVTESSAPPPPARPDTYVEPPTEAAPVVTELTPGRAVPSSDPFVEPPAAVTPDPVPTPPFVEPHRSTPGPNPGFASPPPRATAKQVLPPVGGEFGGMSAPRSNPIGEFFGALFDFSFERHATPKLVKVLFALAMVGGGLWALLMFISLANLGGGAAVLGLLIAPFLFLLFVAYTRILLELVVSVVRIEEHTRIVAEQAMRSANDVPDPR